MARSTGILSALLLSTIGELDWTIYICKEILELCNDRMNLRNQTLQSKM